MPGAWRGACAPGGTGPRGTRGDRLWPPPSPALRGLPPPPRGAGTSSPGAGHRAGPGHAPPPPCRGCGLRVGQRTGRRARGAVRFPGADKLLDGGHPQERKAYGLREDTSRGHRGSERGSSQPVSAPPPAGGRVAVHLPAAPGPQLGHEARPCGVRRLTHALRPRVARLSGWALSGLRAGGLQAGTPSAPPAFHSRDTRHLQSKTQARTLPSGVAGQGRAEQGRRSTGSSPGPCFATAERALQHHQHQPPGPSGSAVTRPECESDSATYSLGDLG